MDNINTKVKELTADNRRLAQLLSLEKKRRGVQPDSLVFVGIANVANHWWCTQQAVFKSRVGELQFFAAYLHDRIMYAYHLGLIDKLPRRKAAFLDIGSEITLTDVKRLLDEKLKPAGVDVTLVSQDTVDKQGTRVRFVNPDLPPEERKIYIKMAEKEGIRAGDLEEDPMLRGTMLHTSRAERYPTIRWNFPWNKYTVVGVPDGITGTFVYEFKTTRNRFLINFIKPVAQAQADLYAYFFHQPKKRVQIYVREDDVTETYENVTDTSRAEATLMAFAGVDAGKPAHPPREWKCRRCDFLARCPITSVN